jgi:hypothetical protein
MSASASTPASLASVVSEVRALASSDTRKALQQMSVDERGEWLSLLHELGDVVAVAEVVATEVFDSHGDGVVLNGSASTQAWLRSSCRISEYSAAERVRLARASRSLLIEPLARTLSGAMTCDHLSAIEHGTRRLPAGSQSDAVHLLTDLAERAPVEQVRAAGRHLATVVDPDGSLRDSEQQFDRRFLRLNAVMDGMSVVDGLLDPEAAAIVNAALQPFLTPDGAADTRTPSQRRADGLVQLLSSACDHGEVPLGGGERPHLSVVVDPEGRATFVSGEPLHPVSLTRIACDVHVRPLLLDSEGVVVDLGRTRRLFSAQQRMLLAARDRGCRWPGCQRPPGHADAHHITSWLDGGATDVSNGLLLCRFHHRLVHEGGWQVQVVDPQRGSHGAVTLTSRGGTTLDSSPRGP